MKQTTMLGLLVTTGLVATLSAHASPKIVDFGTEEYVGSGGRLPTIATDSKNQPHIVMDVGGTASFLWYSKIGTGGWVKKFEGLPAGIPGNGSPQFYNPHLEITPDDIGMLSGVMWHPYGMGFALINDISSPNASISDSWTKNGGGGGMLPIGNLSFDPGKPNELVAYYGNGGQWKVEPFTDNGVRTTAADETSGALSSSLQGGEKNYFWISKAGNVQHPNTGSHAVWHATTECYYQNSLQFENGQGLKKWAPVPSSSNPNGSDHTYPGMCSDNKEPGTAYFIADYEIHGTQGIVMNVYDEKNEMLFASSNIPSLHSDGTSGAARFEPQIFPANNGGAWAIFSAYDFINVAYIPNDLDPADPYGDWNTRVIPNIQQVASGSLADICVDKEGNLHIVYSNGGTRYRKLNVTGDSLLEPVYPIATIDDTTPTLQWAATESTSFELTLTDDDDVNIIDARTVTLDDGSMDADNVFTYDPDVELAIGHYTWYIEDTAKEERSSVASFSVAPKAPVVTAPENGIRVDGYTPTLVWTLADGATWYHVVGLYSGDGEVSIDEWVQAPEIAVVAGVEATYPTAELTLKSNLASGTVRWWVQSVSVFNGQLLAGPWSEQQTFSVGIPGTPQPVEPMDISVLATDTVPFVWTQAGSETNDTANTWYNLYLRNAVKGKQVNTTGDSGLGSEWFVEDGGTDPESAQTDGQNVYVTANLAADLTPGLHKWWIRAIDQLGSSSWSSSASFTVGRQIAPGELAAAVGQGPEISETKPEFQWTSVSWASSYKIIYVHNSDGVARSFTAVADPAEAVQSYTPAMDLAPGTYNWWVQPVHSSGKTGSTGVSAAFQIVTPTT